MSTFLQEISKVVSYNYATGKFTRISTGKVLYTIDNNGYAVVNVLGTKFQAHRLAWLFVTGNWPTGDLDHKNTNKLDNGFENLREVTHSQNMQNASLSKRNKTGIKGVSYHKASGGYQADIRSNGVKYNKYFKNIDDAAAWIYNLRVKLCGEFANHGEAK